MLRSVRIQNYKCLEDTEEVRLAPVTVVIGKNDTGKSSFLEAVWALSEASRGTRWSLDELLHRVRAGSSDDTRWLARWDDGEGELQYHLDLGRAATRMNLVSELLVRLPGGVVFHRHRDGSTVNVRVAKMDGGPLLSAQAAAGDRVAEQLSTWLAGVTRPFQLTSRSADELGSILDEILGEDRRAFDALESALCAAFPNVRGISLRRVKPSPSARTLMYRVDEHVVVPADQVSGGVLAFTALLAEVFRIGAAPNSLLLIEEPENGVHPRRLALLAEHLKKLGERTQIIIATHSPYLLDYFPPSAVRVFGRTSGGRVVIRELESIPLVSEWLADGHSLGELWFNVGEDKILGLDNGSSARSE